MSNLDPKLARDIASAIRKALPTDRPVNVVMELVLYGGKERLSLSLKGRHPLLTMEVKHNDGEPIKYLGHPQME